MGLFSARPAPAAVPAPDPVWEGGVVRCSDRELVPWPGAYGLVDGVIDPSIHLDWSLELNCWVRVEV